MQGHVYICRPRYIYIYIYICIPPPVYLATHTHGVLQWLLRLRTGSDFAPERLPAPDPVLHVYVCMYLFMMT